MCRLRIVGDVGILRFWSRLSTSLCVRAEWDSSILTSFIRKIALVQCDLSSFPLLL